ncbi:PREDICTED: uncharacterized protein LOC109129067 [Camelina sativa]|uniref:Uncharacterized protein LOC109129067 n=1 Tax=Camelina sativa TaxID=90675 RepID=A0ABM1QZK8_CAMSA|nr:PREDICTED: uncharacterized protein LOC109129067 [Camelina sativa]
MDSVISEDDGCKDVPMFTGTAPSLWIPKVERLFNRGRYADDAKLDLVFLYLDGVALTWFMREMNKEKIMDWSVFKQRLLARFAPVNHCSPSKVELFCVHELVPKESSVQEAAESISELEAETNETNMETDGVAQPKVSNSELEPSLKFCNEPLTVLGESEIVWRNWEHPQSGFECLKNKNSAHKVFDGLFLRSHKLQQKKKLGLSPKSWKFKFKNKTMLRKRTQMDLLQVIESSTIKSRYHCSSANIGLVRKSRTQHPRLHKQAHMSRVMCKLRMLHDPRGIKQLLHGDKKLMFLCQVETGEATTLTLKEAKTDAGPGMQAVSELIFQGFKVLTAYPKEYGKLQLQNRLAMDIPEYAVSLTRVPTVNTTFQDRDATLMTWFIHGDAQFQVYHKWRSKPLIVGSLICIQFVHKTKPATSPISRIHKDSVVFHIGVDYGAGQAIEAMVSNFQVKHRWRHKELQLLILLFQIHHKLGIGYTVVLGMDTRQKVQVWAHLWLESQTRLLIHLQEILLHVLLHQQQKKRKLSKTYDWAAATQQTLQCRDAEEYSAFDFSCSIPNAFSSVQTSNTTKGEDTHDSNAGSFFSFRSLRTSFSERGKY